MLESLHVKNLALIDEVEVEFQEGLNILTGETGAGKSIVIGSINLALGAKADKEYIRTGAEYALVELVFCLNQKQTDILKAMDLPVEEGNRLLLQRKIMQGKSQCKVNGEMVTAGQLKNLSGVLLDMYGQHEHQTLLKASKHKEMLDEYADLEIAEYKKTLYNQFNSYKKLKEELKENSKDEATRKRESDLLLFEMNEIEAANLTLGEDEASEKKYHRMMHARKIKEVAYLAYGLTGYEDEGCAGIAIGRALRELKSVSSYDENLEPLLAQLTDLDNLLNDFNRGMADYRESLEFDEEEFHALEERLNEINRLKNKYGTTLEDIMEALQNKKNRFEQLNHYEEYLQKISRQLSDCEKEVAGLCKCISSIRQKFAKNLSTKIKEAMIELNFLEVSFQIQVIPLEDQISADGYDQVEYLLSTNKGEALRPLQQIASGGELSRIMLAFKSVFADRDQTDTLIFDEIDTGISGKTAWKVSERLGNLSENHQIICITHLPQIAAMADSHYMIEKSVCSTRTVTNIRLLKEEEKLEELARLLGSDIFSEAALQNAKEMKKQANTVKCNISQS